MSASKPSFQAVLDLGLRDVGVRNHPRRLAMHFGKAAVPILALFVLSIAALCAIARQTESDAALVVAFLLGWTVGLVVLCVRAVKQSPPVVVKVNAEGTNHAVWLLIAPCVLVALHVAVFRDPLLVPLLFFTLVSSLIVWRARGRVPDVLRKLRTLLAANESVLGDGIGLARGARGRRDAFRVVVATDRRLLVAASNRSIDRLLLVDAPYRDVSRFGIEWKHGGRVGVLSLTAPGLEGDPSDTQVITSIAPANLLSIARALQSHGVQTDDPAAIAEAEHAWEEARGRGESPRPLLDRAAMSTREFDRGLWVLLGLSAVAFYVNPFGMGLGMLLEIAALCVICGYTSGTTSSLAYVAPLNLLVTPAFFFMDAGDVISLMLVLSAVATLCLWAGSALRRATARPATGPARDVARGSLRYAISGPGLIRISGVLLAAMVALVAVSAAAGFELTSLRLAVDELTVRQLPVDGRSNLTGNAASLTYTPGPGLREFVTDEDWDAGPNDGARWELRSSFAKGYNVVSLAHYIFEPRLDDAAAIADFVAEKDDEHARVAGYRVRHTERVVDGRRGYVWDHRSPRGYWYYAAWFPHPVHSIRVECVAKREIRRFRRLCAEATASLRFH